jgi:hypothetical protein
MKTKGTPAIEIPDIVTPEQGLELIELLTMETDPDAAGMLALVEAVLRGEKLPPDTDGDPYFQHEDDPSYIDGDNPLCPG